MSKRRLPAVLSAALSVTLLAGCGGSSGLKTHPASGKATYDDGSPLPSGVILTIAVGKKSKYVISASVGEGGAFKLTTTDENGKSMEGAPVGNYKVGVQGESPPDPENPEKKSVKYVEAKYSNPATSGIVLDIKEGDNNNLTVKAGKKPAA